MKYPRVSQDDLRATTEKAASLFGERASQAFQLCSQTAITVDGILLVHDDDSDEFYLVGAYSGLGFREASLTTDATPIRSLADFEEWA